MRSDLYQQANQFEPTRSARVDCERIPFASFARHLTTTLNSESVRMALWLNLTLIGIAGALGALLRFGVSTLLRHYAGGSFPLGTLVVNVVGCFLLGLLTEILEEKTASKDLREIIGVGFLGALTTFSTFGVETVSKAHQGHFSTAAWNIALNLCVGLAFAALGIWVGRWMNGQTG